MYIEFIYITFSFRKHFGTVLTEEIRIAKFCTEVFVMPKHLMTKLRGRPFDSEGGLALFENKYSDLENAGNKKSGHNWCENK